MSISSFLPLEAHIHASRNVYACAHISVWTAVSDVRLVADDAPGGGRLTVPHHPCCVSQKYKIIVFDTETTGAKPGSRVIELGAYALESGETFDTLINPHSIEVSSRGPPERRRERVARGCSRYRSARVSHRSQGEASAVQIEPEAFRAHGITEEEVRAPGVPAFR